MEMNKTSKGPQFLLDRKLLDSPYGVVIPEVIEKSWGEERIHTNNNKYCMKELFIRAGQKTSIHLHVNKTETLLLVKGMIKIRVYNKSCDYYIITVDENDDKRAFVVVPGLIHRIEAIHDALVIEASTFSSDEDSIRFDTERMDL